MMEKDDVIIEVEFLNKIGNGGFGEVYLALETHTQRKIAIKKIKKNDLTENFFEEARILYQNRHPHVVEMTFAGESSCKEHWYLAMPYYQKGCLGSAINNHSLSTKEILSLAHNFLSGLNCIHQNSMIHGDIKPQNILISDRNEALVADFGIAVKMDEMGMSDYKGMTSIMRPPENLYGSKIISVATDIYHSGIVLFCMINNINFKDHIEKHFGSLQNVDIMDIYRKIKTGEFFEKKRYPCPKNIPPKLYDLTHKALAIDIDKRPQSVQKMLNIIGDIDC